jgi:hypothetical protein
MTRGEAYQREAVDVGVERHEVSHAVVDECVRVGVVVSASSAGAERVTDEEFARRREQ